MLSPRLAFLAVLAVLAACPANGYSLTGPSRGVQLVSSARPSHLRMMAGKGFGKPTTPPKPAPKKKSQGAARRDAAGDAFDQLKASGAPEYMVCIRTVDAAGKASQWMPVGGIAVPRSSSEDMALSMAIFNNEDDLLKGAFRAYPNLKSSKDKFEYGYRLKEFPDDPIRLAKKESTEQPTNPILQWFNTLDSPLNNS
ncbi:hypothetical protein AB1Y20_003312 [Prymnesium parvum]|uniref:PS II complex 12 kDa extrinsic protein n=1 Tax=Prymnesium parvum TaxID=97485 RepID=A0AB34JB79_PRYPA